MGDDDIKQCDAGSRRRPRYPRGWYFHAWLERHTRACAIYAWQYRTRAKALHHFGRHGPHFFGTGRCSWCGRTPSP